MELKENCNKSRNSVKYLKRCKNGVSKNACLIQKLYKIASKVSPSFQRLITCHCINSTNPKIKINQKCQFYKKTSNFRKMQKFQPKKWVTSCDVNFLKFRLWSFYGVPQEISTKGSKIFVSPCPNGHFSQPLNKYCCYSAQCRS